MKNLDAARTARRSVRIFSRDPALSGEVGMVRVDVPLDVDATHFDDSLVWIRRGGAVFPPQLEEGGEVKPIPHDGVPPSVVCDVFKAQMLFAVVHGTRDVFAEALGRTVRWWQEGPLMVRFDCREQGRDLINAYYRRLAHDDPSGEELASDRDADVEAFVGNVSSLLRRARSARDLPEAAAAALKDEAAHVQGMGNQLIERLGGHDVPGWAGPFGSVVEPLRQLRRQLRLNAARARRVGVAAWLRSLWMQVRPPLAQASRTEAVLDRAGPGASTGPELGTPLDDAIVDAPLARAVRPAQEIRFGLYASRPSDLDQDGAPVSTALMQDVAVHETVHALLDGLRPHLLLAPNAESMAFHEGFADIVAVFSRFANRQLVKDALERSHDLGDDLLVSVGTLYGFTATDTQRPIRSAIHLDPEPWSAAPPECRFDPLGAPHALGATLLSAIFAAFRVVYRDKSAKLRSLVGQIPSTQGTELLAKSASDLGTQFLRLLIRAVDYLPPVDARFGDYLRALLTADAEDYPEDVWRYRERLVEQFRRYRIPVVNEVAGSALRPSLHVSALLWSRHRDLHQADGIFGDAQDLWEGSPNARAAARERVATALASEAFETLSSACGLNRDLPVLIGRTWTSTRIVDGRRLVHERGLELIQHRDARGAGRIYGGSTLLFRLDDGRWKPRFAIFRRVDSRVREEEQRSFLEACDRDLAHAWRALRDDEDRDAMIQRFTRHFHHAHCPGGAS